MFLLWKYFTELEPNSALQLHWSQCLSVHLLVASLFGFDWRANFLYADNIFLKVISAKDFSSLFSPPKKSAVSTEADSHISLLTPARGGQAKQNTILVFFSFFYFAPPKHSFSDIWHFSWKSSCKESLPSDVCKIFSVAHFWFNTTWTGGGQTLVQFCRLVVLNITMLGCVFLLLRAIGTGAYLKLWFKVQKGGTDTLSSTTYSFLVRLDNCSILVM